MIKKIKEKPEIYEDTNRNGVKTYRVEDEPWGSDGRFLSERQFKKMKDKKGIQSPFQDTNRDIS